MWLERIVPYCQVPAPPSLLTTTTVCVLRFTKRESVSTSWRLKVAMLAQTFFVCRYFFHTPTLIRNRKMSRHKSLKRVGMHATL
jgi:hypothetical protein